MGRLLQVAEALDRLGLRGMLAKVATPIYSGHRFGVDRDGHWVNQQRQATIVSPQLHVTPYDKVHNWVLENWCWGYVPREGDTVIDVGAGIGEETVVFSKLVGRTGRVLSIEAHPDTFACLQETVRQSRLGNVQLIQCAIAEADGVTSIGTGDCHVANSILGGGEISVPARSLDSLSNDLRLGEIAFLKMNIEGAERLAVKGMSEVFSQISALCISCHDFLADLGQSDDFRTKLEVRSALEEVGYRISQRPSHPESWVRDYIYASK